MQGHTVDVAIIGAGTAGLNARREVVQAGGSALLIESGPYGTTCARVGCMPSKLLIAAAAVAHQVAQADRFGIHVNTGWSVDGAAVMARVRRERDRFVSKVVSSTEAIPADQRLRGRARFIGPTTLQVGAHNRVEARAVVIATGSSPWLPPPFDAHPDWVIVNDDVFELTDLPASMAVIGTGIIGLELGQALHYLGVKITFFNPFTELGPFSDPALQQTTRTLLEAELDLRLSTRIQAIQPTAAGTRLVWRTATGEQQAAIFETVLVAAGRRPNLTDLDLVNTGLSLDQAGMPPWNASTTQCGAMPIFLAGDASNYRPLLHEASDEGQIAGFNAIHYPTLQAQPRRTALSIAFTEPQMAIVGDRYADLPLSEIEVGEASYHNQGRARVIGQNQGLIRLYARQQGCTLVGAELLGPQVEHLAHLIAWAIQQGLSVQRALQMPVYHPVLEEGLRTALRDLAVKLRVTGNCHQQDFTEVPGG
jgi:dihydrolipoamide dehydrogenase